jgi:large subunit ribosomal protein L21
MYAVIQTGGKQYRVQEGDVVRVEKLDAEPGAKVSFDQVLLVGEGDKIKFGKDVAKAKVPGEVVEQDRDKKIVVFKKRRRKHSQRTQGHRQSFTAVRIGKISAPRAAAKKKAAEETAEAAGNEE